MCSQFSSCFVPGLTQTPCNVGGMLSQAVQGTVWKCCWTFEQHCSFMCDSWQKFKRPQIQEPLWLMIRLKFLCKSCLKSKPRRNLKYVIEGTSVTLRALSAILFWFAICAFRYTKYPFLFENILVFSMLIETFLLESTILVVWEND